MVYKKAIGIGLCAFALATQGYAFDLDVDDLRLLSMLQGGGRGMGGMGGLFMHPGRHDSKSTKLHKYALSNNVAKLERKLATATPADINAQDKDGDTPLACALLQGHQEAAQLLLGCEGLDLTVVNNKRMSYQHMAAFVGLADILQTLIGKGVDVNAKDGLGHTPLLAALRGGHRAVIDVLLNNPAVDVTKKSFDGASALQIAAQKGDLLSAQQLLSREEVDVNAPGVNNTTPLCAATATNKPEMIDFLLGVPGIDVTCTDADGVSAIHFAAGNQDHISLRKLLDRYPDAVAAINAATQKGQTPLMSMALVDKEAPAKKEDLLATQTLLLERKADVGARDKSRVTTLHLAVMSDTNATEQSIQQLLDAQANPMALDSKRRTPLAIAAEHNPQFYEMLHDHVRVHGVSALDDADKAALNDAKNSSSSRANQSGRSECCVQ